MKCLTRASVSAKKTEAEMETSAELKGLKKSAPSSCLSPSISRPVDSDPTGPHNKENLQEKHRLIDVLSEDEVVLSSSSFAEDSGYLSLQNSHVEHYDGVSNFTEVLARSPAEKECRLSPIHSGSKSSCLPVLHFQEAVCKQLSKGYRKNQHYDWTVINKLAKDYGLHNIIGAKMGLESFDILCGLLKKSMKHILTRILSRLGACDLINCTKVSKTWWKIILQDERSVRRCREAEPMLRDSKRLSGSFTRDLGLSRVVFSCLQSVASSTPASKSTKKSQSHTDSTKNAAKSSRFAEFQEAGKSLKSHESLRSCRLCGSPARFDSVMKRAVCTRASCAFVFCWSCQSAYHGSTPCKRGVIKASSSPHSQNILACSKQSKRNIRRL